MEKYLSVKETSALLKLSKTSIYRLAKSDPSFPARNVGLKKKIVINRIDLEKWIKNKNIHEELIRLPSNTIIFRRRIHET